MEDRDQEEKAHHRSIIPDPVDYFTKLIFLQVDIFYRCLIFLFSPIFFLFSLASDSYHRAEETTAAVETAVQKVPSKITHVSTVLLKKIGFGLLGAVHVCVVLMAAMVVAAAVGVGLVQMWVEEPVFVRDRLFFDYTEENPNAVFHFGGVGAYSQTGGQKEIQVGHTIYVSLVLLMPESDFNRDIGVFQVTAELLSAKGNMIAKSSQPCMLQFRSLPIRLTRTFIMGIPLVLGISSETQKLTIELVKHKEGNPRTRAIRITLIPRAGTVSLPQLYEAEILLNSKLPWTKQMVYNWKWTFYVWVSMYVYIIFLVLLLWCFRPLLFPMMVIASLNNRGSERDQNLISEETKQAGTGDEKREKEEALELLRKWRRDRRKRKAMYLDGAMPEAVGSSASSMSLTKEDASVVVEEDIGDSESVCLGG